MKPALTPAEILAIEILAIEQAAARAWPAGRVVNVDGWQLRLSGGGTRRANSVLPLQFDGRDLDAAIVSVERLYRAQKTRCYFQVVSTAQPNALDATLEARGYTYEEPCLLMAKQITLSPMPDGVVVSGDPTAAWLSVYGETLDPARQAAVPAVLAAVPVPRAFLLVLRDAVPLSSALAVLSLDGIALVECVATCTAARRSGGAHTVMHALESWAAANGAHTAALQVIAGNSAARKLYEGRGYVEVGRYHYRWRDVA